MMPDYTDYTKAQTEFLKEKGLTNKSIDEQQSALRDHGYLNTNNDIFVDTKEYYDSAEQRMAILAANNRNLDYKEGGIQYILKTIGDETSGFLMNPYAVKLSNKAYTTYAEMLEEVVKANEQNTDRSVNSDTKPSQMSVNKMLSPYKEDPIFTRMSVKDTSPGGNEAINVRFGFCRDDDIIQPLNAKLGNPDLGGMGRVYLENYDITQHLIYITAGVPEFRNVWDFYSDAVNIDIAGDVNRADWGFNIPKIIGHIAGGLTEIFVTLVSAPFKIFPWISRLLSDHFTITKYYDFASAMPHYYKYCDTIFLSICEGMGLFDYRKGLGTAEGAHSRRTVAGSWMGDYGSHQEYVNAMPAMFKHGPSIYFIRQKRNINLGIAKFVEKGVDDFLSRSSRQSRDSFWSTMGEMAEADATGATKFIAFRMDKSTDTSESFSNTTGQSAIQQTLNSMAASGKQFSFSTMGGKLADIPILGSVVSGVRDVVQGVASHLGAANVAATIMSGCGFFDIPEVWMSSSFTKNYSFRIPLRAPYGDPLTIAQAIYLPLSMLLPLVCPRAIGLNSYSSPFVIRAYSTGKFAIPLGMIDSMTITRGSSEFGWSMSRLPTVINVSFSIKDLSPLMQMALMAGGSWSDILKTNSTFQEYMMTLSGMGLNERLLFWNQIRKRVEELRQRIKTAWEYPALVFGAWAGNLSVMKIYGALTPISSYGN